MKLENCILLDCCLHVCFSLSVITASLGQHLFLLICLHMTLESLESSSSFNLLECIICFSVLLIKGLDGFLFIEKGSGYPNGCGWTFELKVWCAAPCVLYGCLVLRVQGLMVRKQHVMGPSYSSLESRANQIKATVNHSLDWFSYPPIVSCAPSCSTIAQSSTQNNVISCIFLFPVLHLYD